MLGAAAATTMVATDIAARGIHVDGIDLVIHADPPAEHKAYLHRSGRTARAGESGSVVTLVPSSGRREMSRLMADAGITPKITAVRSGEAELSRITGARAPSGVPLDGGPAAARPKSGHAPFRGMGSRPGRAGGDSRRTSEARQLADARKAARVRRAG